jgi:hypothetical protein
MHAANGTNELDRPLAPPGVLDDPQATISAAQPVAASATIARARPRWLLERFGLTLT